MPQANIDYLIGNEAHGEVADTLAGIQFNPHLRRPFFDSKGRACVSLPTGAKETRKGPDGSPVCNADGSIKQFPIVKTHLVKNLGITDPVTNSTTLRKDEWELIDSAVVRATADRRKAWNAIQAVSSYNVDGMSVYGLTREAMTDPGFATVDMDGLGNDINDTPVFTPDVLPLPITHAGFWLSSRRLAESRRGGMALDTNMAETAGRRVAETIEKMTIGETDLSSIVIGSSSTYTNRGIYGFMTHPDLITRTGLTAVASDTAAGVKDDVLNMRGDAYGQKFYGPYTLYYSTHYDEIMDDDYWVYTTSGGAAPTRTLRQRLMQIDGINAVERLDFMTTAQTLLLVQMTPDVVRAVSGMSIRTLQWESQGGLRINFKVMAIQVPDIRSSYIGTDTTETNRKCGIVKGTVS